VRSATHTRLLELRERFDDCVNAGAIASRCKFNVHSKPAYADVLVNRPMAIAYQRKMEELGCAFLSETEQRAVSRGSTDMGNVTHHRPGFHVVYRIGDAEIHTEAFRAVARTEAAHES